MNGGVMFFGGLLVAVGMLLCAATIATRNARPLFPMIGVVLILSGLCTQAYALVIA